MTSQISRFILESEQWYLQVWPGKYQINFDRWAKVNFSLLSFHFELRFYN